MRKPLIAANWKMYKTPKESLGFLSEFLPLVKDHTASEIAIFPTMSSLGYVIEATKDSRVTAGAQTMHTSVVDALPGRFGHGHRQIHHIKALILRP